MAAVRLWVLFGNIAEASVVIYLGSPRGTGILATKEAGCHAISQQGHAKAKDKAGYAKKDQVDHS